MKLLTTYTALGLPRSATAEQIAAAVKALYETDVSLGVPNLFERTLTGVRATDTPVDPARIRKEWNRDLDMHLDAVIHDTQPARHGACVSWMAQPPVTPGAAYFSAVRSIRKACDAAAGVFNGSTNGTLLERVLPDRKPCALWGTRLTEEDLLDIEANPDKYLLLELSLEDAGT